MRVVGEFNNISDELKSKIVQLKPGEFAEYQFLKTVRITDPVSGKTEVRYPHQQFHARDKIYDYGRQAIVEIGVIAQNGVDPKTNLVTLVELFEFERPRDGLLVLDGKNAGHRELHEHLQLRNDCQDGVLGEDRDASVELQFRLINRKKEAIQKSNILKVKRDVLVYVTNLDAEEARDFAASMNWDHQGDLEELMARITEYADSNPLDFKKMAEDPLQKTRAIIKKAIGTKITFDPVNYSMKWMNGEPIASMERRPGENEVTAFAKWIGTSTKGEKVLARLRSNKPAPATT